MLPEIGTPEREALEQEAHDLAMQFLKEEHGNIPNALYRVYDHFRQKFLFGDRGAWSTDPDVTGELMTDARQLEALVADDWAAAIRAQYPESARMP